MAVIARHRLDDAGYVGHTPVNYLNCVIVKYFVELGSLGKVLVDELKGSQLGAICPKTIECTVTLNSNFAILKI